MRIVMITDDVQIDRRILLEAESLYGRGHEIILLAEKGADSVDNEKIGNIKIERVSYPEHSAVESRYLQFSSKLNRGLSRLSSISINVLNRIFGLVLKLVSGVYSLLIRINQRATNYFLRGMRWLRRLPLRDSVLRDRIIYYDADIIHAHDLPQLRSAVEAKKTLGIPLVYDAHELYPEIETLSPTQKQKLSLLEKRLIKNADVVITVNEFIAKEMSDRYDIEMPEVILNSTNWPDTIPEDRKWNRFRERFNIPENQKILVFQGWMSHQRGLQKLVYAMTNVAEDIHLVFMGYGEARDELELIVKNEDLDSRVHFMDAVAQDVLLSWTASADAGIIPYQATDLNNYYCSPNKLFEYIEAGLPIIANDLPFLRKIISGEEFGVVHDLTTVDDYADAIMLMFDSDAKRQTYKENIMQQKEKYSWNHEQKKFLSIYDEVG